MKRTGNFTSSVFWHRVQFKTTLTGKLQNKISTIEISLMCEHTGNVVIKGGLAGAPKDRFWANKFTY